MTHVKYCKKEPQLALLTLVTITSFAHLELFHNLCKREDVSLMEIIYLQSNFQSKKRKLILNKHNG